MLTRLQVNGFKSLDQVDIRFGPFTCVAGVNGVGKSNLFDAIRFLSALADKPLLEAALSVRDEGYQTADIRSLFLKVGDRHVENMTFEADMIIPLVGIDDLGQEARPSITFVRYRLELAYRDDQTLRSSGGLEITHESLVHLNLSDAPDHLWFPHSAKDWRNSVLQGRRTSEFLSTYVDDNNQIIIRQHQDGRSGRTKNILASRLPRTVLSEANAAEAPTALLTRREMQSWRLLQLEPRALREPDNFNAPAQINTDGAHLPATLYQLAHQQDASGVYQRTTNTLKDLIDDIHRVWVDRDDKRELLTLMTADRNGTAHTARSLSDGTLRFLALAIIEQDPNMTGVICLEEPENGIHPARIPAILDLLQDIATDTQGPVNNDNPLRQVIINTHSPAVVQQVPADSLVLARLEQTISGDHRHPRTVFEALSDTWRTRDDAVGGVRAYDLLAYLNPVPAEADYDNGKRRVIDREDIHPLLPGFEAHNS